MVGVIQTDLAAAGIPSVSLRVGIPHYLMNAEHPQAVGALQTHLAHVLNVEPPEQDAEYADEVQKWRGLHDEVVAGDVQLQMYVRMLEHDYDQRAEAAIPSADDLGAQFEEFLREQHATTDRPAAGRRDPPQPAAAAKPWSRSARMSSIDSRPTLSRTCEGVTPDAACSSGDSWLCVVVAGWITRLRGVTDVGDVAVQRERLDELLAGFDTADDVERDDRPEALALAVDAGAVVPRARLEARVRDGLDLIVGVEVLADPLRVLPVTVHAQAQRLEPLQEQERIERRDRHAHVAQHLDTRLEDERAVPERRPVGEAVITRDRVR